MADETTAYAMKAGIESPSTARNTSPSTPKHSTDAAIAVR